MTLMSVLIAVGYWRLSYSKMNTSTTATPAVRYSKKKINAEESQMATATKAEPKEAIQATLVKEIVRGGNKIVISKRKYNGVKCFDIRKWIVGKGQTNRWFPTKNGIMMGVDKLKDVVDGLCSIAEQEGLDVTKPTDN